MVFNTHSEGWRRCVLICLCLLIGLFAGTVSAQTKSILVVWDPVDAADLAGYKVYVGSKSGYYDRTMVVSGTTGLMFSPPAGYDEYYIVVTAFDSTGNESAYSEETYFKLEQPAPFSLKSNYPNPFNPVTRIPYVLTSRMEVLIAVYDIRGRRVRQLVDAELDPGNHEVEWDGTDSRGLAVANGVYFCRMQVGTFAVSRKLILAR